MLKGDAPIEGLLTAGKRMPGGVTYMAVQLRHQLAIEFRKVDQGSRPESVIEALRRR